MTLHCDCVQETFGAFLSETPHLTDHFTGTGESWLFTYTTGHLVIHNWAGDNTFILKGNLRSLVIGSGEYRKNI